ncbi:MAG: DNA polymerase III subunit gamma/tau [Candidatus Neomarinimicrobiota bacterium]
MSYQVLSRKWRPRVFEELIGQSHVATTLQNALKRGRVAHAYMFTGPRGVGKTTTARILAKALNCPRSDGLNPCNDCKVCREISRGNNLDVLEIDGASNRRIDEIRELREAVKYPPMSGKYRIYIIDEVHMLTTPAFNALLKTLEEPPEQLVFVLATTDPQKVPQTILSRTQRFDFRRVPTPDIAELLVKILADEQIDHDAGALMILARKAEGSVRDGLSLLDQVIAYHTDKIDESAVMAVLGLVEDAFYGQLLDDIGRHDTQGVLARVAEIFDGGYDIKEVSQGFNQYLRDGILSLETGEAKLTSKGALVAVPEGLITPDLLNLLALGLELESQLRFAQQPRILLEHQLLKMAGLDRSVSIREVLEGLSGSAVAQDPPKKASASAKPAAGSATPKPAAGTEPEQKADGGNSGKRTFERKSGGEQGDAEASEGSAGVTSDKGSQALPADALERLRDGWETIVGEVAGHSQGAAATLEGSEVASLEGRNLTVHLPASQTIHLKILTDKRQLVEQAIEEHTGWKVRVLPTIPESRPKEKPAKEASAKENALMDELIETFKGEEY